jgi:hypothetical protein
MQVLLMESVLRTDKKRQERYEGCAGLKQRQIAANMGNAPP